MVTYLERLKLEAELRTEASEGLERKSIAGARMQILTRWATHVHPDERHTFMEDMRILGILCQASFLQDQLQREFTDGSGAAYIRNCYENNHMFSWIDLPQSDPEVEWVKAWPEPESQGPVHTAHHIPVDPTIEILMRDRNFEALVMSGAGEIVDEFKNRSTAERWELIQALQDLYFVAEDEVDGQRT
jgi:hypothetical protein